MIILILIISFYLEGILSNIGNILPLFTLISLIIIYPYLYNLKKDYYKICFIIGLLYDVAYTDTLFLNAFIFLIIGFFIIKINIIMTNNIFNVALISLIVVILYRILVFIILIFINYIDIDINSFFVSIINSLFINILYGMLLYKITDLISKKKGIYKMD
ncbi:MAG: rod shape-determining protein MreD [Bacilli bacterium]|nr:rod shape-determining protein MreD [Bacilli bacterium]